MNILKKKDVFLIDNIYYRFYKILYKSNFEFLALNVKTWDSSQTSPAVFNTYGGEFNHDFSESNIAKGQTWISSNYWSPRGVAVTFDSTVTITRFLGKFKNDLIL